MKLNENLQICLLAIANRYPESTLDINQEVPGPQSFQAEKCTPLDLMERLQSDAPQLLRAPAQLVVNAQERAIYLVEQPQQTPAFWIRSRERTQEEEIASLRRENAALKAEKRELKTQLLRCFPFEAGQACLSERSFLSERDDFSAEHVEVAIEKEIDAHDSFSPGPLMELLRGV